MLYRLEFTATSFEDVSMNPGYQGPNYPEWPPTPLDGSFVLEGRVHGFPYDRFRTEGLSMLMLALRETTDNVSPRFSAYYVDETVEEPTEQELATGVTEVTVTKKNRSWQFALGFGGGGGTVAGVATKSFWKSILALLASAGAGYSVGSQFEYWSAE